MKNIAVVLILLLAVSMICFAQVPPSKANISVAKAYANAQTDTSAITYNLAGAKLLSLCISVTDSCHYIVYVDYRAASTESFSAVLTDSLTNTTDAGKTSEYSLRSNAAEKFTGLNGDFRTRIAWQAAGNGVTSPAYTSKFNYRP
jgi:hypothetical protein